MALNKSTTPAANAAPAFEDEGNTAVADRPSDAAIAAATAAPPAASVPALAQNTAVAVGFGAKFVNISTKLKNALAHVPFGGLRTLKAKAGSVIDESGANLGSHVTLEVLSYNDKWQVSPGDDSAEASKLLRTSYDGITIDGDGGNLEAYLQQIIADGYTKAKIGKRIDVIGILIGSDKKYEHMDDIVMIDLAPTSVARFEGQMLQASAKVARGTITAEKATHMKFQTVAKQGNGKNWSAFDTVSAD